MNSFSHFLSSILAASEDPFSPLPEKIGVCLLEVIVFSPRAHVRKKAISAQYGAIFLK
jgi:hypothetical protein